MPSERELIEIELDALVAIGDVETETEHGVTYYRLTEQGYEHLREHEAKEGLN